MTVEPRSPLPNTPNYFIKSVHFKNILSFDDFKLTDFKKVNIFIGGNSSGKSNIIRIMIGFVHGKNSSAEISICFADGKTTDKSLNDSGSSYRDYYYEIPPFRTLIIPEQFEVDSINWRLGIVDLQKIMERESEFYEELENIIGIEGFRLRGRSGTPQIFYEEKNRRINAQQWTNWGHYCRKVKGRDKWIPIDNLGWGTKSAIILFYNLFFKDKAIVFIEEPEISMHPDLMKKLFTWAFDKRPDCQFFMTTHSPMLIDKVFLGLETKDISIHEIYSINDKGKEGITLGHCLNNKIDQIRLLEQMGFQSSNLLFANYVIWVEGPSDIFYYEALLNIMGKAHKKEIRRGVHYELMWYGGRQVPNMIDIESNDGLNLLFSFSRKGAIFWDYDGKTRFAIRLASRIKDFMDKLNRRIRTPIVFRFGCTGIMMSGNEKCFPAKGIPFTIENLMSKKLASSLLSRVFPSTDKTNIKKLAEALENITLTDEQKNKITPKKKVLGQVFLQHITEGLKVSNSKDVLKGAISFDRCETIRLFFSELYHSILQANGIECLRDVQRQIGEPK
jgi:hypothetical protein